MTIGRERTEAIQHQLLKVVLICHILLHRHVGFGRVRKGFHHRTIDRFEWELVVAELGDFGGGSLAEDIEVATGIVGKRYLSYNLS